MVNKKSKYYNSRLADYNIKEYLLEKYGAKEVNSIGKNLITMDSFVQRDFGVPGDGDCTLTSLMTIIYYHCEKSLHYKAIYSIVRNLAEKHFFNVKTGTNPFFIKSIFDKSLKVMGIKDLKTKAAMVKGIGYSLKTIKKAIDCGKPVVLSMFNDGRDYYQNHSITVAGYETFKVDNKEIVMLLVYDNWSKTIAHLDYDALCIISSINY